MGSSRTSSCSGFNLDKVSRFKHSSASSTIRTTRKVRLLPCSMDHPVPIRHSMENTCFISDVWFILHTYPGMSPKSRAMQIMRITIFIHGIADRYFAITRRGYSVNENIESRRGCHARRKFRRRLSKTE